MRRSASAHKRAKPITRPRPSRKRARPTAWTTAAGQFAACGSVGPTRDISRLARRCALRFAHAPAGHHGGGRNAARRQCADWRGARCILPQHFLNRPIRNGERRALRTVQSGRIGVGLQSQHCAAIFRGGAHRAQLDAARVGKKIAVAQYEKTIQTAFREVADALEQTIAAQRRRLKLSTLRYQHGIDGYARVLAAQTDLYAARQALIAAHLARWANLVDLYRALGGGWRARRADV